MTTYLGKSCSFGLLGVSFVVNVNQSVCCSFSFVFEDGIPDHCLSIYFEFSAFA